MSAVSRMPGKNRVDNCYRACGTYSKCRWVWMAHHADSLGKLVRSRWINDDARCLTGVEFGELCPCSNSVRPNQDQEGMCYRYLGCAENGMIFTKTIPFALNLSKSRCPLPFILRLFDPSTGSGLTAHSSGRTVVEISPSEMNFRPLPATWRGGRDG